jgi:hypothetical protein
VSPARPGPEPLKVLACDPRRPRLTRLSTAPLALAREDPARRRTRVRRPRPGAPLFGPRQTRRVSGDADVRASRGPIALWRATRANRSEPVRGRPGLGAPTRPEDCHGRRERRSVAGQVQGRRRPISGPEARSGPGKQRRVGKPRLAAAINRGSDAPYICEAGSTACNGGLRRCSRRPRQGSERGMATAALPVSGLDAEHM